MQMINFVCIFNFYIMKYINKTAQFFNNLSTDQKTIIKMFVDKMLDVGPYIDNYNFQYIKYDYLIKSLNDDDITSKFMHNLSITAQRTFGSILSLKDK